MPLTSSPARPGEAKRASLRAGIVVGIAYERPIASIYCLPLRWSKRTTRASRRPNHTTRWLLPSLHRLGELPFMPS